MSLVASVSKVIRAILRPVSLLVMRAFFDKKYLTGRYFDSNYMGFLWAARTIWQRNILRLAKPMPWPASLTCIVYNPENISFHPDDLHIFQVPGTYFQNFKAHISIGKGSYIAQNVGIITANHSFEDLDAHQEGKSVSIGECCWIGMNAVILPGVTLGNRTIVAAGAVVTRSFEEGYVVVGGVPAKIIKRLDKEKLGMI